MELDLLIFAAGWAPLWIAAWVRRREIRPGAIVLGALLAALAGGMCGVELRRHGVLLDSEPGWTLPLLGARIDETLRFALVGAAGAVLSELILGRKVPEGGEPSAS